MLDTFPRGRQKLTASNGVQKSYFGHAVSIFGYIIIGAHGVVTACILSVEIIRRRVRGNYRDGAGNVVGIFTVFHLARTFLSALQLLLGKYSHRSRWLSLCDYRHH